MNKKEKDELTPEEKERLAKVFITLIEKLEKWNLALRAQEGYRNLGIQSEPPTLTVEDVDRFYRLFYDGDTGHLPDDGAIVLLQLVDEEDGPFPFLKQPPEVQRAIFRTMVKNQSLKEWMVKFAFGDEGLGKTGERYA